jgi:hypothetical protein
MPKLEPFQCRCFFNGGGIVGRRFIAGSQGHMLAGPFDICVQNMLMIMITQPSLTPANRALSQLDGIDDIG